MRVVGPALAGAFALTVPIVAHAVPLGEEIAPTNTGIKPGIIHVWGGCGWGWHPVPGHWSGWRGWVPPHCAPNHAGAWQGAYRGPGYPNWGWLRQWMARSPWRLGQPPRLGQSIAAPGRARQPDLRSDQSFSEPLATLAATSSTSQ